MAYGSEHKCVPGLSFPPQNEVRCRSKFAVIPLTRLRRSIKYPGFMDNKLGVHASDLHPDIDFL